MPKKAKTRDAVKILRKRYVQDDPDRRASLEQERVNAQVARMIHDLRLDAGLTQAELAKLIGTTPSVISRLEDSDYQGHSLTLLSRLAAALNQRLTVTMTAEEPGRRSMMLRGVRRSRVTGGRLSDARARHQPESGVRDIRTNGSEGRETGIPDAGSVHWSQFGLIEDRGRMPHLDPDVGVAGEFVEA